MPTLEHEANVRAWDWIQQWARLYPAGELNLRSDRLAGANGLFGERALAATISADNAVATLKATFPDLDYRTGAVPHAPGGRNGTWGGGVGHIIPHGAKHVKEAKVFMRWIATEGQWILYQHLGEFPPYRPLVDRAIRALDRNDPRLPLFAQMEARNPRPPLWANVIGKLISAENTQIISLRTTPREALSNLQREIAPLYRQLMQ